MDVTYHIHHTETYPKEYRRFLLEELKVGKKYILLEMHRSKPLVGYMLQDKIHTLCSLTDEQSVFKQLKLFERHQHFLNVQLKDDGIPLDDDFIDIAFLDDSTIDLDITKYVQELNRVLRLNSFVILTQRRIALHTTNFSKHLHTFLSSNQPFSSFIAPAISRSKLSELFAEGAYTKDIYYQQHINFKHLVDMLDIELDESDHLYKSFLELFELHQENGKVEIGLVLQVSYGVFNKYTPEISLRRSFFFHALRPFAFVFYLMVKGNIYGLRLLYKLKNVFNKRK